MDQSTRRDFLHQSVRFAAGAVVAAPAISALAADDHAAELPADRPKLRKAMKYNLVHFGASVPERFDALKEAGFEGCEIDSPMEIDRNEAVAASEKTGVKIHGVIDSVHWKDCLSDPDPAVRARGLDSLKTALDDAKTYGASTVLLVPGKVTDTITFDDCWSRSTEEIRKAIPWADERGVKIAIEVVWNNFITKPEQFVKYIDQFNSPTIGGYFDCSNMIKYGVPSADWIRALGKRMLKFDFKGYSKTKQWVKIGEGDEDWPEIKKALDEVGYRGWATAEVGAKDMEELKDIYARMTKVLG